MRQLTSFIRGRTIDHERHGERDAKVSALLGMTDQQWLLALPILLAACSTSSVAVAPEEDQTALRAEIPPLVSEPISHFASGHTFSMAAVSVGKLMLKVEHCTDSGECGTFSDECTATALELGASDYSNADPVRDRLTVLTAEHCISRPINQRVREIVYRAHEASTDIALSTTPIETSSCGEDIISGQNCLDYAILQSIDEPTTPVPGVYIFGRAPTDNERVFMLHHPNGGELRVSYAGSCRIRTDNVGEEILRHRCLTEPGSSGALLFSEDDRALLGLHRMGTDLTVSDLVYASNFYSILQRSSFLSTQRSSVSLHELQRLTQALEALAPPPHHEPLPAVASGYRTLLNRGCLVLENLANPRRPAHEVVYFEWDRTSLSEQTRAALRQRLNRGIFSRIGTAELAGLSLTSAHLRGHTDREGSARYNVGKSERMARAVRDELVELGVSPSIITLEGLGENFPSVHTEDGVREPLNRRVEVLLEFGLSPERTTLSEHCANR